MTMYENETVNNHIYLRDAIETVGEPISIIAMRVNAPPYFEDYEKEKDMLIGYCSWDGKNLISLDGDDYFLNDPIDYWEYDNENRILTCWSQVDWEFAAEGEDEE